MQGREWILCCQTHQSAIPFRTDTGGCLQPYTRSYGIQYGNHCCTLHRHLHFTKTVQPGAQQHQRNQQNDQQLETGRPPDPAIHRHQRLKATLPRSQIGRKMPNARTSTRMPRATMRIGSICWDRFFSSYSTSR